MRNTVGALIKQLQELHRPDEPVMFQYLVAEHTSLSESDFAECIEHVDDHVYSDLTHVMLSALCDAAEVEH